MNPVAQARVNLDNWNTRGRRRGESSHWRRFNPVISSLSDLHEFRAVNASTDRRLGLDDARRDQGALTNALFDQLVKRWSIDQVLPLLESVIGAPPHVRVSTSTGRDVVTDLNDLYLVNFALSFSRHFTPQGSTTRILEIGGGYGGTIAKLARLIPDAQFVLVDLPPAGLLQSFYLDELFPGDVTVIPHGSDIAAATPDHRFIVCGPLGLDRHGIRISGVINTRSFGEMDRSVVARYFRIIERDLVPGGIFMNVNRLQKIGYRFTAYPYDDLWDVVESAAAFAQDGLWHLTTRRRDSVNLEFANWTRVVPMPPAPNLARRLMSQVRRLS